MTVGLDCDLFPFFDDDWWVVEIAGQFKHLVYVGRFGLGRWSAIGLEADDDDAAFGVGESDQGLGKGVSFGRRYKSQPRPFSRFDEIGI